MDSQFNNESIEEGQKLLKTLEMQHGRFRLDLGPYATDHGDDDWRQKVFGEVYKQFENHLSAHKIDMFNCPVILMLRNAALKLIDNFEDQTSCIAVGWTSIPILNACAVRNLNALSIAVNMRLSNALYFANGLNFQFEERKMTDHNFSTNEYLQKIKKIVRNSSSLAFDNTLSEVKPFSNRFHTWMSSQMTHVQMLFVILHEYAHVLLGHLDKSELWLNHPFKTNNAAFFSGNVASELEADEFAIKNILDPEKWPKFQNDDFLMFSQEAPSYEILPGLLVQLFSWFQEIAPNNYHDFYKIPRSHPHPLDRIQQVVDYVKKHDDIFNWDKFSKSLEVQYLYYFSENHLPNK